MVKVNTSYVNGNVLHGYEFRKQAHWNRYERQLPKGSGACVPGAPLFCQSYGRLKNLSYS